MSATVLNVADPSSANSIGGELVTTTQALTTQLALVPIVDTPSLEQAVDDRRRLGELVKQIEGFFKPIKDMAHKLHAAICERERAVLAPVLALDRLKAGAISGYKAAEDEKRRQRERALADDERRRQQARATEEAAALESAGESALAEAVLADAIAAPPPVVVLADEVRAVAKFRRDWKWRFKETEGRALELLPRAYLAVDTKKLNAYATAHKSSANLPGIEVYYVDTPIR